MAGWLLDSCHACLLAALCSALFGVEASAGFIAAATYPAGPYPGSVARARGYSGPRKLDHLVSY